VCDIYEELELSQSNISQHLKILKEQRLVSSCKEGVKVLYQINYEETWTLLDAVEELLIKQTNKTRLILEKE
jgi:ArsR family transcriptional regulator